MDLFPSRVPTAHKCRICHWHRESQGSILSSKSPRDTTRTLFVESLISMPRSGRSHGVIAVLPLRRLLRDVFNWHRSSVPEHPQPVAVRASEHHIARSIDILRVDL